MPGDTLDDQRDAQPGSSGLPVVDSTPRRGPSGRAGHLHGLSRPPRRERRALRRQKRRERSTVVGRHPKTTILLLVLVALTPVWVSAGTAATDPALGPTVGGRLTEWVRDHGGGGIVTWAEDTWYTWHAPPKGGKPAAGAIPVAAPTTTTLAPVPTGPAHLPAPAAIVPFVADPSPGEGQWHAIGRTIDGVPTMYAAFLRPNDVYTSLVTGVAWMDTKLLSANLYAGSAIPGTGQAFPTMAPITGAALTTLDAAFNSGFRMQDADGGFYLDGIAADPLRTGAASLVIDSAGDVDIGAWGSDVTMTPTTVAVRQNLDLIVDDGAPAPGLDVSDSAQWGATLGGAIHVWRSGLGVTADGALVYVAGSGLSIVDLANVLVRAGAVRAMELDINTDWVNFTHFDLNPGVAATGSNGTLLTYDEQTYPDRYFAALSRDFVTMSVRSYSVPAAPSHYRVG